MVLLWYIFMIKQKRTKVIVQAMVPRTKPIRSLENMGGKKGEAKNFEQ